MTWRETLDAILPDPGIDLRILADPHALARLATRAMRGAATRLSAPRRELDDVLDALFAEPRS